MESVAARAVSVPTERHALKQRRLWSRTIVLWAMTIAVCGVSFSNASQLAVFTDDPQVDKPKEETPKDKPAKPVPVRVAGGVEFWAVKLGLASAKEARKPLLFVYGGAQPDEFWASIEKRIIGANKKTLKHFVAVVIPRPVPRSAQELLGGIQQEPVIALADFRGTVLKRWDKDAPGPGNFRSMVKKVRLHNAKLAQQFKRAEELIAKSRYALKQKKYKQATLLFLQTEELPLPSGSAPVQERKKLRDEIDEVIDERRKKGKSLEDKEDLIGAINEYEKIMNDFPLPDVRNELRKRVRELWSKLRGFG